MSNISASTAIGVQFGKGTDRPSLLGWIKRKLAERLQRVMRKAFVAELRSLDHHLLDVIDIDPDMLASNAIVTASRQNPHVLAASIFVDCFRRSER
jgi:hypothetical protein